MRVVGAYIDLPKWDTLPPPGSGTVSEGEVFTKTGEGLEVYWLDGEPPERAQVYIEWTPRVYAVWEEEEIENGNGNEAESAGPNPDEEANEEPGQLGDFVGEAPATGPEEPQEVE